MTRTISILPFLFLACDSSGSESQETSASDPVDESHETVSQRPQGTAHRLPPTSSTSSPGEPSMPTSDAVSTEMVSEEPLPVVATWETQIRLGDDLSTLAQMAGSTTEELASLNGIENPDQIQAGQSILLPLADEVAIESFQLARDSHSQQRLDGYLTSRGGVVDVDSRVVDTGEIAEDIANGELGIPISVLASFNGEMDLDNLQPGDIIYFPVLGDSVASIDFEEVDSMSPETGGLPVDFD